MLPGAKQAEQVQGHYLGSNYVSLFICCSFKARVVPAVSRVDVNGTGSRSSRSSGPPAVRCFSNKFRSSC